ncbi:MAG: hypothetical protein ACPL0A_00585, partial [Candidatus Micrarchaeia archaeon]
NNWKGLPRFLVLAAEGSMFIGIEKNDDCICAPGQCGDCENGFTVLSDEIKWVSDGQIDCSEYSNKCNEIQGMCKNNAGSSFGFANKKCNNHDDNGNCIEWKYYNRFKVNCDSDGEPKVYFYSSSSVDAKKELRSPEFRYYMPYKSCDKDKKFDFSIYNGSGSSASPPLYKYTLWPVNGMLAKNKPTITLESGDLLAPTRIRFWREDPSGQSPDVYEPMGLWDGKFALNCYVDYFQSESGIAFHPHEEIGDVGGCGNYNNKRCVVNNPDEWDSYISPPDNNYDFIQILDSEDCVVCSGDKTCDPQEDECKTCGENYANCKPQTAVVYIPTALGYDDMTNTGSISSNCKGNSMYVPTDEDEKNLYYQEEWNYGLLDIWKPTSNWQIVQYFGDEDLPAVNFMDCENTIDVKELSGTASSATNIAPNAKESLCAKTRESFTNPVIFMHNEISKLGIYLNPQPGEKPSVKDVAYVLGSQFKITKGVVDKKWLCYGSSTYDGEETILAPQGMRFFYPQGITTYALYESPVYNLQLDGSTSITHLSPFSKQLSQNRITSLNMKVPTLNTGIRNMGTEIKEEDYAEVVLYNMTIEGTDEVNILDGGEFILRNKGDTSVTWYYGRLDCGSSGTIEDAINYIQTSSQKCSNNGCKDVLKPKYSFAPSDMAERLKEYANNKSDKYDLRYITIKPNSMQSFSLANKLFEWGTQNKNLDKIEYLFYHPESGKRIKVTISRVVQDVPLKISSFNPNEVFAQEGSRVCFLNKDNKERIVKKTVDGTSEDIKIDSGAVACEDVSKSKFTDDKLNSELKIIPVSFGSEQSFTLLGNITEQVTRVGSAYENPLYESLVLNPDAPATPAIISTEMLDISVVNKDNVKDIAGKIAQQSNVISNVCNRKITRNVCSNDAIASEEIFIGDSEYLLGTVEVDGKKTDITVNATKCVKMLPILIRLNSDKNISSEDINKIKSLVDEAVKQGAKIDALVFVLLVDDTGRNYRGKCSLQNYFKGLENISRQVLWEDYSKKNEYYMNHKIYSFVLLGINFKDVTRDESCWSYEELRDQTSRLLSEEVPTMIGSGIIGLGQYCLVDKSCYPISTGIKNGDYGLMYSPDKDYFIPWSGWQYTLRDRYLSELIKKSYGIGGLGALGIGTSGGISGMGIFGGTGGITSGMGGSNILGGTGGITSGMGGSNILGGTGGITSGMGGSNILGGISGTSTSGGIFVPDWFSKTSLEWKNPYTREWFEACGRYYTMGEGKTITEFNEEYIEPGQQGNYCDPSRLMELYKRYKCR